MKPFLRPFVLTAILIFCCLPGVSHAKADKLEGPGWALPDRQGQVVILNFWATWCTPCRAEMPALDAYYQAHRTAGLTMLAVSMDDPSRTKAVREIASRFHFPVKMAKDMHIPSRDRPSQLPMTLIYDRSGVLRYDSRKTPGLMNAEILSRIVDPLLQSRY